MEQLTKFRQFAYKFDLFDSPFEFEIQHSRRRHSTLLGSIYSILTIFLTLIFLFYRIIQWKEYMLQPVITRNRSIDQNSYIDLFDLNLTFIMNCSQTKYNINIFQKNLHIRLTSGQNQIIYFHSQIINDNKSAYLLFQLDEELIFLNFYLFLRKINNFSLQISKNAQKDDSLKVELTFCNEQQLCSDPTFGKMLITEGIKLRGRYNISSYDHSKDELVSYNLDLFTQLSPDQVIFFFSTISIQKTFIDYGYPFKFKTSQKKFISEGRVYESRLDYQQSKYMMYNEMVVVRAYISLYPVIDIVDVQHANILDIIIMAFSFYKMMHTFGFMVFQRRSRFQLQNIVEKELKTIVSNADTSNQKKISNNSRTDIFYIFEQLQHIDKLIKDCQKIKNRLNLLKKDLDNENLPNEKCARNKEISNSLQIDYNPFNCQNKDHEFVGYCLGQFNNEPDFHSYNGNEQFY